MTTEHSYPRLGAAYASRQPPVGIEVFGVVSTDGTAAGLVPLAARMGSWNSDHCGSGDEHLWMVTSTVKERLAWAPIPAGLSSMAGIEATRRSVMRVRITTSDSAGSTAYELDVGQSLELYAGSLRAELVAPQGSVELIGDDVVPQQGLLFQSQCQLRMLQLEASRGVSSALLTETVHLVAGQAHIHRVPNGARRLTAYASPMVSPPVWQWLRGDPLTMSVALGTVAWTIDQPRMEVDVPSATHLHIDPAPSTRVFTLVWTITP